MQKITRPIWFNAAKDCAVIIDQRLLPHKLALLELYDVKDVILAIKTMAVRGAPLIGVAAAYGVYLAAAKTDAGGAYFEQIMQDLRRARPTAVNLASAVDFVCSRIKHVQDRAERKAAALKAARDLEAAEIERCRQIGEFGLPLIEALSREKKGAPVNILTHCNAGWLACVAWGTATAPIYMAHEKGLKVHVWVDETRPLNQGMRLTAWELAQAGVPCTVICDNTGGHLMQRGMADMVIVGADRVTANGHVANKIGTYLKALAARAHNVPFYAALPSSSIDWQIRELSEIPIEERDADEVLYLEGLSAHAEITRVSLAPLGAKALNIGFDVTPAELVSGLITERGVCAASSKALRAMFPDLAP